MCIKSNVFTTHLRKDILTCTAATFCRDSRLDLDGAPLMGAGKAVTTDTSTMAVVQNLVGKYIFISRLSFALEHRRLL